MAAPPPPNTTTRKSRNHSQPLPVPLGGGACGGGAGAGAGAARTSSVPPAPSARSTVGPGSAGGGAGPAAGAGASANRSSPWAGCWAGATFWFRTALSSCCSARAVGWRPLRSLLIALRMTASIAGETCTPWIWLGGSGGSTRCLVTIPMAVGAWNGSRPVINW